MKKEEKCSRELSLKELFILAIITGVVLALTIFIISNNIMPPRDNIIICIVYIFIIIVLLSSSFIGFIVFVEVLILTIIYNKKAEKSYKESLSKVQNCLSSKFFSEVILKDINSDIFSEENFVCMAKLDDDGNIIYKVHLDLEGKTDDYENFFKNFDVDWQKDSNVQ